MKQEFEIVEYEGIPILSCHFTIQFKFTMSIEINETKTINKEKDNFIWDNIVIYESLGKLLDKITFKCERTCAWQSNI